MFDDFFNRFFRRNKKEEPKQEPKKPERNLPIRNDLDFIKQILKDSQPNSNSEMEKDFAENLMKALSTIKTLSDNPSEDIDETLGTPDRVEYHEEDGLYIKKSVWLVGGGEMVKMVISDIPFNKEDGSHGKIEKSLEEQLEDALKNEDYETAANLRDELNKIVK